MQEFSSVTASSYDADSLTPMLNDKAAAGWSVVSIVSAGSNIVAYLEREADPSAVSTPEPAAEPATDVVDAVPAAAESSAVEAPSNDEPAGWAAAPDTPAEDAAAETVVAAPEQTPAADTTAVPVETSIADLGSGVTSPPVAEPEAEPAPVAEPTVPAGWYADPSGRFELRYWDGLAWTEHVSRSGQQFTDPPVA